LVVYPCEVFHLCAKVSLPALDPVARVNAEFPHMILVIEWDLKERVLLLTHTYVPVRELHTATMTMVQGYEWRSRDDAAKTSQALLVFTDRYLLSKRL